MAPFDHDARFSGQPDYRLAENCVTLFRQQSVLEETIDWLLAHGYQVVHLNASNWTAEADLHRDFARALDFPDYYGGNLAALNDCLSDVAAGDYGTSPETAGLVLVLIGYDGFATRQREVAQATLDVVARNALSAMRFGHRMFCLVQSDDPDIALEPVGAVDVSWNGAEWLDENRRMQKDDALVRILAEVVVDLAWFFESCDDSVVDLDDAVKQMEWMSHKLGTLPTADRTRLIALIHERAESESEPEFREFLYSFAETSGF